MVNSLHWQGIARIADGLKPEAFAEDGLIEAVRGPDEAAFCLGVQWHPEWAAKSQSGLDRCCSAASARQREALRT